MDDLQHSCAEQRDIKCLLWAVSQETFLWQLIEVSSICRAEAYIMISGEHYLPLSVHHVGYLELLLLVVNITSTQLEPHFQVSDV